MIFVLPAIILGSHNLAQAIWQDQIIAWQRFGHMTEYDMI
jgi:hypothetical protein